MHVIKWRQWMPTSLCSGQKFLSLFVLSKVLHSLRGGASQVRSQPHYLSDEHPIISEMRGRTQLEPSSYTPLGNFRWEFDLWLVLATRGLIVSHTHHHKGGAAGNGRDILCLLPGLLFYWDGVEYCADITLSWRGRLLKSFSTATEVSN